MSTKVCAWGKPPTASPIVAGHTASSSSTPKKSLLDIQREEQEENDSVTALKLQLAYDNPHLSQSEINAMFDASSMNPQRQYQHQAPQSSEVSMPSSKQEEEDRLLAALLQAQLDEEEGHAFAEREKRANQYSYSKVSVSLNSHKVTPVDLSHRYTHEHLEAAENAIFESDDEEKEATYDKRIKTFRDKEGVVFTKHNIAANGAKNKKKMEQLPFSFPSGDIGSQKNLRLSNKVFNSLKKFADKSEKGRHRTSEKRDTISTNVQALDKRTRLVLYKMVNKGLLEAIHGCISTGKESVVFHAVQAEDPLDLSSPRHECAVKVFKTTLTEFKERQQFIQGDRRYERKAGPQSAARLVKLWAEKEMANLLRMHSAGIRCPRVVGQKMHVLVMSFVGEEGRPAPKLKDAVIEDVGAAFVEVKALMRTMYQDCHLVHADLSEYNLLFFKGHIWVIDVGQAVEPSNPRGLDYLFRDCIAISQYFNKLGLMPSQEPSDLFEHVTGVKLSEAQIETLESRISSFNVPKDKHCSEEGCWKTSESNPRDDLFFDFPFPTNSLPRLNEEGENRDDEEDLEDDEEEDSDFSQGEEDDAPEAAC